MYRNYWPDPFLMPYRTDDIRNQKPVHHASVHNPSTELLLLSVNKIHAAFFNSQYSMRAWVSQYKNFQIIWICMHRVIMEEKAVPTGTHSFSVLTAIFPREHGLASFIEAKDDGSGGDNWSYKLCKAPVESSPPTNRTPNFLQAGCPSCHPTNSIRALKGKYGNSQTRLWSSNFAFNH